MTQPDKNLFLHSASEGRPDPCRHISLTTFAGDAYLSSVHWAQGQTRVGFPTTWESSSSFANPVGNLKAVVGDYIRIESGAQAGKFKKVTAIEGNKRVTLASAWTVDQGPVDWSLIKVIKSITGTLNIPDIFEPLTGRDLVEFDKLLIRMQGRLKGSIDDTGNEYTRQQILNHLNGSVVEVTL